MVPLGALGMPAQGRLRDKNAGTANIGNEPIAGFMDAMIMPYTIKPPSGLDQLQPGDSITADVVVESDKYWLENVKVTGHSQSPAAKPAASVHIPTPGDPVPDFKLINQNGKNISLHQYRGQTLLLTLIYTRCPFPDFCPRVSHEFAVIDRRVHGALTADLIWYHAGYAHGSRALGRLCRVCLEPDSCVRRVKNLLEKHGLRSLLVAKFVPGLNAMAAPVAGTIRMPWWQFVAVDSLGIIIWASTFELLGLVFSKQLERLAVYARRMSAFFLVVLVIAALTAYGSQACAAADVSSRPANGPHQSRRAKAKAGPA